ncbi:tetratricopeptide repeat protein [Frigidibacter oleivorans]|uniref:tetratricopeptide repeat protein n=1 Tax=Frigidibacter oleivorans TaxID=2487129 RepID=UPI000F8C506C|nr:tetratricopeptide repeat protein [Frigidibacter oleivorans]
MVPAFRRPALALSLAVIVAAGAWTGLAAPLRAEGVAGPYLAARVASGNSDFRAAADYFTRALIYDRQNAELMESAILSRIGMGDFDGAVAVADAMRAGTTRTQVADLVAMTDMAARGDWDAVLADLDGVAMTSPLVEGLMRAWAEIGRGRMSEALVAFDAVAETEGLATFAQYHKAMALASVGDLEGADAILAAEDAGPLRMTRRAVLAHAQILSQLERRDDALGLIDDTFGREGDPVFTEMAEKLEAGETLPFDVVRSPEEGVAEIYHSLASALTGEGNDVFTLVYARLAQFLRPDEPDTLLLVAGLLERQDQFELATAVYGSIPRESPAYPAAELGRAEALIASDRRDAAIEVLEQLARSYPDQPVILANLGDTLRQAERYADAIRAYDAAIALFDGDAEAQWPVYYARGISYERQKDYDRAETDMRKALDLRPNQPQVLNYLGYSFLEQRRNLEEAQSMIERAVAERPEDGYIVDSLAWAYYRLGRYDDAVAPMEKAVALMPVDAVLNDHLGDVYWAVGRKREAEFQWKRALSFSQDAGMNADEVDPDRIRRKLEIGLDAVLAEEGAAPLAVTQNAD